MVLATRSFHAEPGTGSAQALPPVALLHGFAASGDSDFVATGWPEALAAAGRSSIVIDLPGHGSSPAIAGPEEARTSAVIAAILEAIALTEPEGPVDVIGYSLGGRLAWELPAASPRIRRLALGGVSPMEPFAAVDPAELGRALAGVAPENPLVGMMAAMISAPGADTASLATLIPGLASEPFDPQANAPRVPTLLVAGEQDPMSQGVEVLLQALPDGRLARVPGDHRGALDSAEFRAAAIEFLAG
ncbi:hydrolase [Leucobacter sp. OLJS4]|uniref:alpha/beta fold hydrolase n=1 Tax=unclassified Leucobacter TaxID=2621730 RepID=UPI000C1888C4|nr:MULTISPECIES: alpha/beta fold hydrolase [unclassified Leucobacter]PII83350.1 hydrolase [Leucobacter sp. OLCALW19]PII86900.1 hydrolase [Leucobacter sp. OLTLW20]PII91164.1 hydrolase [Leucobacter sp. OLAS13]PII98623.1 hydrolase [Leucobacter sp. OLDS2]PIJ04063.1 hydrolase [Leucobacter sp. OLIS6]